MWNPDRWYAVLITPAKPCSQLIRCAPAARFHYLDLHWSLRAPAQGDFQAVNAGFNIIQAHEEFQTRGTRLRAHHPILLQRPSFDPKGYYLRWQQFFRDHSYYAIVDLRAREQIGCVGYSHDAGNARP